ncbi:hypothetical protein LX32DRAFT_633798 [Colletotrichum zoysiae]|uniref:Uncharacterized protein n=1 Tax=Colletotrichum zoysiae TaxID=1216348 RepID=A0AAD9MA76_9PEZI|nr:hypothetical protein LX32DRAFT_633798 [Colletotrichum zoysiae]
MGDDFIGIIRDQHRQWMEAMNKKLLVVKTKTAKADANNFFSHLADTALPELFQEDWPTHPLEALLPLVGDESRVDMFVTLNKEIKAANTAQSEPKSALKSDAGDNKRKKKGRVQTVSKDSQQTVVDLLSDDRQQPMTSPDSSPPRLPQKKARTGRSRVIDSDDSQQDGDEDEAMDSYM